MSQSERSVHIGLSGLDQKGQLTLGGEEVRGRAGRDEVRGSERRSYECGGEYGEGCHHGGT